LFPEAFKVISLNVRLGSGQTSITKLFNAITAKKSLARLSHQTKPHHLSSSSSTVFQFIYPWDDERKKNNRPLLHGLIGSGIPAQI
jgi:hypothetical protein